MSSSQSGPFSGTYRYVPFMSETPFQDPAEATSKPEERLKPLDLAVEDDDVAPLNEENLPTEDADGELVLWRVFGLADVFEDRPLPAWSTSKTCGPGPSDRLQVSIGDLPSDLSDALREWRAQVPSLLNAHVGHALTYGDIQSSYEQGLTEDTPAPFVDPYPLWFTMRLSRPTRQRTVAGLRPLWFVDLTSIHHEAETFEGQGNTFLDGALARMVGALPPMNLGILRYPGRDAWLLIPGRAAWRVLRPKLTIKDSGVHVGRTAGWTATVPIAELENALSLLPSGQDAARLGQQTAKSATFFAAARAVPDDDDLGRFVYAFAGLELLATQVEGNARRELLLELAKLDSAIPFRDLFWPDKGDDWADRNLIFKFAAMAALHSPKTALTDTAVCKQIARTRNALFHGKEASSELRGKGVECTELLRRYLGLVAAHEAVSSR